MEFLAVLAILGAAIAGFFAGKKLSSSEIEKNRLEQALKEKNRELESFHSKVNTHFEKTADLFNHVSDSYQSLYDHMAKSSNQLCASQTFQVLPKTAELSEDPTEKSELKEKSEGDQLFDANHLYNAHDYRNKETEISNNEAIQTDSKVVEIASAKEEQDSQALDYAIKENGVVNHNSLNVEGVKNS